ncbi:hypothetical protein [Marinobacter nauticus]|uniref:hypothetical protein n=1 Tax=Marinobacter nauticus TaxID=2743 RepID=UPI001CFDB3E3|nr:hypothetical protein [Marinobacter nauticus]
MPEKCSVQDGAGAAAWLLIRKPRITRNTPSQMAAEYCSLNQTTPINSPNTAATAPN